jgi:hypothetical protein
MRLHIDRFPLIFPVLQKLKALLLRLTFNSFLDIFCQILETVLRSIKMHLNLIDAIIEFLDGWSNSNHLLFPLLLAAFRSSYLLDYLLYCAHENNQDIGANVKESDAYHGPADGVLERKVVVAQEIRIEKQVIGTH